MPTQPRGTSGTVSASDSRRASETLTFSCTQLTPGCETFDFTTPTWPAGTTVATVCGPIAHVEEVAVDPIAPGLEHGLLRAAIAAGGEEDLGVEHVGDPVVGDRRGHEHAVRHGLAVERHDLAVGALGHGGHLEGLDIVEQAHEGDEVEARAERARLRAFWPASATMRPEGSSETA